MARADSYYAEVRARARAIWEGINELKSLQQEWNALDYTNTLANGSGSNAGLTKTEIGAVVFDSTNALLELLGEGHATNLAKLL